jgi:MYXO-CTERM domain-containing protein
MSMSFFPENLKLMSSVGADERDAPAISVRNAAAAVALYAIASRRRRRAVEVLQSWLSTG